MNMISNKDVCFRDVCQKKNGKMWEFWKRQGGRVYPNPISFVIWLSVFGMPNSFWGANHACLRVVVLGDGVTNHKKVFGGEIRRFSQDCPFIRSSFSVFTSESGFSWFHRVLGWKFESFHKLFEGHFCTYFWILGLSLWEKIYETYLIFFKLFTCPKSSWFFFN